MTSYLPSTIKSNDSTYSRVNKLKEDNSDYEWYPTTDEMIQVVIDDLDNNCYDKVKTVMDIGCGDGRVLTAFIESDARNISITNTYGIEKSPVHVNNLPDYITFIGGDFYETTLSNKESEVVFCNPPYSEYEHWVSRIITEANTSVIYIVLPERWINSESINLALKRRDFVADVLHTGDFLNAERAARAKTNVIRIIGRTNKESHEKLRTSDRYKNRSNAIFGLKTRTSDPFSLWFNDMFPNISELNNTTTEKAETRNRNELFKSANTIDDMVAFYQKDMKKVLDNYHRLNELDSEIFEELKIDLPTIKKTLHEKVSQLTAIYWNNFINNYKPITQRLTTKYRNKLKELTISKAKNIDFTSINALLITEMVINKASNYSTEQVKDFFFELSNPKAIKNYKSNQKVFGNDNWRYQEKAKEHRYYKLDYRIVQHRLFKLEYSYNNDIDEDKLADTINDILIISKLVGMKVPSYVTGENYVNNMKFNYGEKITIDYSNSGKKETLFTLKVFKNGNQHLVMNKEFALRLNVMVGKLLGWITSAEQACEEMDLSKNDSTVVKSFYNTIDNNVKISYDDLSSVLCIGN